MKTNFEIDGTISVVSEESYFDLHNDYDFIDFEHTEENKIAVFHWTRAEGSWVDESLPMNLKMTFSGVKRTKEKERDPEIPHTEDTCLSSISFLPTIFEDSYEDLCPGYRSDEEHLSISLMSKAGFKVWAESAELEIDLPNQAPQTTSASRRV